jgi:DNA polymerase IV
VRSRVTVDRTRSERNLPSGGGLPRSGCFGLRSFTLLTGSVPGSGINRGRGRTITVRVRFADLRSVTRSVTLPAPISATRMLAEVAEELVRGALADYPQEKTISLLAISVSNLEEHPAVQLELPIGLEDEPRRPGSNRGMARGVTDRAVDTLRARFGWGAVGYGSVALGISRSVPDEFRRLAEKEL